MVLTLSAVGVLLEKGRLKLEDEIQMYVPAFPKKPWPVRPRQAMGHLAGVRNDGGDEGAVLSARCERRVDGLQSFVERSLLFEPGTEDPDSSDGWILVSAAEEAVADEPFLMFMRKQIFSRWAWTTRGPFRDAANPASGHVLLPEVRGPSQDGLHLRREIDYSCYGDPAHSVHSVPPGALRYGHQRRQAAAARHGPIAPDATATGLGAGDGLRSGLGPRNVASPVKNVMVGHDGDALGGMVGL